MKDRWREGRPRFTNKSCVGLSKFQSSEYTISIKSACQMGPFMPVRLSGCPNPAPGLLRPRCFGVCSNVGLSFRSLLHVVFTSIEV